jgi:hypothetical protein
MIALAAVVLALTRPPAAYLDTGTAHVPLALSSWCWAAHCGAPIARASHAARVVRGRTVTIHLGFVPTQVHLAVGGAVVPATIRGEDVSWRVTRGGGLSLTATGVRGFATYVGRLVLTA